MSLIRKSIREKIVSLLLDQTDAKDRVYPSRVLPVWQTTMPAILVYTASDTREVDSQPKRYVVTLDVRIEVLQKGVDGVDGDLDILGSQVEYVLDQDFTVGGLVEDILYVGTELVLDREGDTIMGNLIMNFTCKYYVSSVSDPLFLDDLDRVDTEWLPNSATSDSPDTVDTITGLSA